MIIDSILTRINNYSKDILVYIALVDKLCLINSSVWGKYFDIRFPLCGTVYAGYCVK